MSFMHRRAQKNKNPKVQRAIRIGLFVGFLLFLAPLLAGYFQIESRDGPFFYPEALHTPLYIIGYEAATGIKPRKSFAYRLYDRPLFWGLPSRPKPEDERKAHIQRIAERQGEDSPMVRALLEEQEKIRPGQP
jgi:hypothetical protein